MSDKAAFTRREFLNTSLVVVSTAVSIPTFLQNSALVMANQLDGAKPQNKPGLPDNRILVIVQLSGGNDGLNTVIPFGFDEYYKARPQIAIPKDKVISLDANAGVGLHPSMTDFKSLIDDSAAAVVQGVGYPNPNRSHFASMDIWHTADPAGGKGYGWLGKALDQAAVDKSGKPEPTACVCIGHDSPVAAQGKSIKPITFENVNQFRWIAADGSLGSTYDKINRAGVLKEIPADATEAAFVMRTALDAQLASDRIRAAVAKPPITAFPNGQLANQLRMVAAMIRANLPTRVYYVALGGFDTHSGQPNRQANLLQQFSNSLKGFHAELKAMNRQNDVLTLSFSEFGRRVGENASQGTDHGTAGPVYLMGDMIQPGLLGTHPSLARNNLDEGDLRFGVDFRSVYAAVLEGWLKVDSTKVLGKPFAPARILNPKLVG